MPPKDHKKHVSKMNTEELKIVAKNTGINIDGANTVAKMREIIFIISASEGYSKKYDFVSNTWITRTNDAQMPSTQAITASKEEEREDPRTDDAKKIQKLVRSRQEKKSTESIAKQKSTESSASFVKDLVRNKIADRIDAREGKRQTQKNIEKGRKMAQNFKARLKAAKPKEAPNADAPKPVPKAEAPKPVLKAAQKKATPPPSPKAAQKAEADTKMTKTQLQERIRLLENEIGARGEHVLAEKWETGEMKLMIKKMVDETTERKEEEPKAVQTRGARPPIPPPGIFPIQPKELEEDHKEENQLKKITRHNVEKIDDSIKVKPSSTVKPTIEGSDIRRALAKSNNRRFKIGTNVIKYHRLNGIGKTATDFI